MCAGDKKNQDRQTKNNLEVGERQMSCSSNHEVGEGRILPMMMGSTEEDGHAREREESEDCGFLCARCLR